MCGIAGIVDYRSAPPDGQQLQRMLDAIRHRGPDDEGTWAEGPAAIGMRRLSIIDLVSGHQPIHNEDKTIWVVFNGEIYNYATLRSQLEERGHRFYTQSDTETLVHLYEEYGEKCVDHLNGMFGFALWDTVREKLLIARDRAGEKQVYYVNKSGWFGFGSEIKALLAAGVVSKDIDLQAVDGYLAYLYCPAPLTVFEDVRELPAAHLLVLDRQGLRIRRYWDLKFAKPSGRMTEEDALGLFKQQLRATVRSRLVSDVPLGALLSGGVDSSAIVALMSECASGPIRTFSIGYGQEGGYYDERRYARMVAQQFATEHHEFVVEPDIVAVIPEIVRAFDQPFADSSVVANYYVFAETRKHVKVVLSGLGGDEVAAGYNRYIGLKLHRAYQRVPGWMRRRIIAPAIGRLADSRGGGRFVERAKRFVRSVGLSDSEVYFDYMAAFGQDRRQCLWSESVQHRLDTRRTTSYLRDYFDSPGIDDVVDRALYADTMTYLPGDLLTLTDRMSMRSSIEARAPFVDHALMELMATVPARLKAKGVVKKYLLKKAFEGILPHEILHRRKQGFTIPLTVWLRGELLPYVRSSLSRARLDRVGLFNTQYVERLVSEHASAKENHHSRIWALLMFMEWYEQYVGL